MQMSEQDNKYIQAVLPSFLKFDPAKDLIRLGKKFDGGYLVSKADIEKSEVLVSLGINDDWSFEKDFIKLKSVPVIAYDASVSKKIFVKNFIKSLLTVYYYPNPKKIFRWLVALVSHSLFFTGNHKHIHKFVGLNADGKHCSIEQVLSDTDSDRIFLKIDIEGSEYRILDTLVKNKHRINALAIELHDCDIHLAKIENFVKSFGLNLVHIHANNHSPIRNDDYLPTVLELTFSKHAELKQFESLPHSLDMPNHKRLKDIQLTFEK